MGAPIWLCSELCRVQGRLSNVAAEGVMLGGQPCSTVQRATAVPPRSVRARRLPQQLAEGRQGGFLYLLPFRSCNYIGHCRVSWGIDDGRRGPGFTPGPGSSFGSVHVMRSAPEIEPGTPRIEA